jgi:hypothetical protein
LKPAAVLFGLPRITEAIWSIEDLLKGVKVDYGELVVDVGVCRIATHSHHQLASQGRVFRQELDFDHMLEEDPQVNRVRHVHCRVCRTERMPPCSLCLPVHFVSVSRKAR